MNRELCSARTPTTEQSFDRRSTITTTLRSTIQRFDCDTHTNERAWAQKKSQIELNFVVSFVAQCVRPRRCTCAHRKRQPIQFDCICRDSVRFVLALFAVFAIILKRTPNRHGADSKVKMNGSARVSRITSVAGPHRIFAFRRPCCIHQHFFSLWCTTYSP